MDGAYLEWGQSWESAAVWVVIVQAELREVGGHVFFGQELLARAPLRETGRGRLGSGGEVA